MARYDGKFLRGAIGNIVFREQSGINTAQGKAENIRQTKATISAGKDFAIKSAAAKVIRTAFIPLVRDFYDGKMINRMTTTVINVMGSNKTIEPYYINDGNYKLLEGFEFNMNSPLCRTLPVFPLTEFTEDEKIRVSYPAFDPSSIKGPEAWDSCFIRIEVLAFDFRTGVYSVFLDTETEVKRRDKEIAAQEWLAEGSLPDKCLVVTALAADFIQTSSKGNLIINNKQYHPASMVSLIRKEKPGARGMGGLRVNTGYRQRVFMIRTDAEKRIKKAKK